MKIFEIGKYAVMVEDGVMISHEAIESLPFPKQTRPLYGQTWDEYKKLNECIPARNITPVLRENFIKNEN